jgi:hypothetical protein
MSFYNYNAGSLFDSITSGLGAKVSGALGGALKSDNPLIQKNLDAARGIGMNAAMQAVNDHVPVDVQRYVNQGGAIANAVQNGDFVSAGMEAFRAVQGMHGGFMHKANPLFGGVSPHEARKISQRLGSQALTRKNIFYLEITSALGYGAHNMPAKFNMYATDVEYSPFILSGDKQKVGGAPVDLTNGSEPVELSITTYDDDSGTLKRWFSAHHAAAAARDGTIGEPGRYAIHIEVLHGYTQNRLVGYRDIGLFRPENLSISLSRHDDNMEELQMSFTQLDPFML